MAKEIYMVTTQTANPKYKHKELVEANELNERIACLSKNELLSTEDIVIKKYELEDHFVKEVEALTNLRKIKREAVKDGAPDVIAYEILIKFYRQAKKEAIELLLANLKRSSNKEVHERWANMHI